MTAPREKVDSSHDKYLCGLIRHLTTSVGNLTQNHRDAHISRCCGASLPSRVSFSSPSGVLETPPDVSAAAFSPPARREAAARFLSVMLRCVFGVPFSCRPNQSGGCFRRQVPPVEQSFIPSSAASFARCGRSSRRSTWRNAPASANAAPNTSSTASANRMRASCTFSTRRSSAIEAPS